MRAVREEISLPFNFEMSTALDIVELAKDLRPAIATLVPERREELTTEGGLHLRGPQTRLKLVIDQLRALGTQVSLFIDPTEESIRASLELGATHVELHTGAYAHARAPSEVSDQLSHLRLAAEFAIRQGLTVNAGHGLTTANVGGIARIPGISDLNIGHSIISRSVFVGLREALGEMSRAIRN
jgi:pyridoxine 5-phosphate synthase